ncbi:hypothetical protein HanPSC8_Chr01g0038561 [Helianthus annuus]|nr:hypothetical protein HanPSC8_Chr01g0038561 [Helianthus annuus]
MIEIRRKVLVSGKSVIYWSTTGPISVKYRRYYRYRYSDRYLAPNRYIMICRDIAKIGDILVNYLSNISQISPILSVLIF